MSTADEYTFALCLSHDVDRVYKTYQYITQALSDRNPAPILDVLSGNNPWWQFEQIMAVESELGVRSSFNILCEQHISDLPARKWIHPQSWKLFAGRYDVTDPQLSSTMRVLADGGWEIGLQGSYQSSEYPERFVYEKIRIEEESDVDIQGNRQHYLRLDQPATWRQLREAGINYDMSLAAKDTLSHQYGYDLIRPFDDEFVVFPWTVMDVTAMRSAESFAAVRSNCERLLERVRERSSVLVLDWHQRVFHEPDFPNWSALYKFLITRALEMGAWIGAPGRFYDALTHPDGTVDQALERLATTENS